MPYSDPEQKKAAHNVWKQRAMARGYGKALYARRKQRLENERILRKAILHALAGPDTEIRDVLTRALADAPEVTGKPLDYLPTQ